MMGVNKFEGSVWVCFSLFVLFKEVRVLICWVGLNVVVELAGMVSHVMFSKRIKFGR